MSTFKELRAASHSTANVRKSLGAIILVAPTSTGLVTTLTATDGGLVDFSTEHPEFKSLGLFSSDGISFEKEAETADTTAHGYMSPVRQDISSISRTITANALEPDRRIIRELTDGTDLSDLTASADGEIAYNEPEVPQTQRWRLLAISRDINKSTGLDILRANFYPSVELTSLPSESWGDDALVGELVFTSFLDDEAGYARRRFLAGPGLDPEALGYGAAPVD